jgi:hypothetical protein
MNCPKCGSDVSGVTVFGYENEPLCDTCFDQELDNPNSPWSEQIHSRDGFFLNTYDLSAIGEIETHIRSADSTLSCLSTVCEGEWTFEHFDTAESNLIDAINKLVRLRQLLRKRHEHLSECN